MIAALFGLASSASATVGGFEGSDGNQACLSGIDWSCLTSDYHLSSATDGGGSGDDVFSSSSKEEQPDGWSFVPGGAVNGKTDILNVWSTSIEPANQAYMFLAFRRQDGTGNSFVSFELNQIRANWRNSVGVDVPCRTDNDVLISYELPSTIKLYRWNGSGGPAACPDGATGSWIAAPGAATAREEAVNAVSIPSTLPGAPATLAPGTFGEAALDLDGVAKEAGITKPCAYFAGLQAHSRESNSVSSSLSDFVKSAPISVAACKPPDSGGGDTTAPDAPTLSADAGCHAGGAVTLSGTAEAGSQVQVRDGATSVGVADAQGDGSWTLVLPNVADGSHSYTAVARDAASNVSPVSGAAIATVDATPPAAPVIVTPAEAATVATGDLAISGTADAGTGIAVLEGADVVASATAAADGTWTATVTAVAAGAHTYAVRAADACGTSATTDLHVTAKSESDGDGSGGGGLTTGDPGSGSASGQGGGTGSLSGTGNPGTSGTQGEVLGSSANGTCASKAFALSIPGKGIRKVAFYVDGHKVAVVSTKDAKGAYTLRVDPAAYAPGAHKVAAKVTLASGKTGVVPMRGFSRCKLGACVSRRAFKIHVKKLHGDRVVRARVLVNGKRVKVLRGKRLSAPVVLKGLPKGTFKVEIVARTKKGRTVRDVRYFRTCVPKK